MCTRKQNITLAELQEYDHIWKMPTQLQQAYINKARPKMMVKCGKCYECKQEKARNWTYKIWLESLSYKENCFITLTYKDNKKGNNLNKSDLQNFIKRLRKNNKIEFKYFGAGEYGEKKGRAHYHLIILGWQPKDIKNMHGARSNKGNKLYTSKIIHDTWGMGRITVQPFGIDEIGYLTLYLNHNAEIEENINHKELKERKKALNKIKIKHKLIKEIFDVKTSQNKIIKLKKIKDLTKEEYKRYKEDYNTKVLNINTLKKQPEFNISSKHIGFENYIKKEYYKYDLIIDKYKYERPKEYLRKIYENTKEYNEEVIEYTRKEYEKRKDYAEQNYIDPNKIEAIQAERQKEEGQKNKNFNNKKLNKIHESIF